MKQWGAHGVRRRRVGVLTIEDFTLTAPSDWRSIAGDALPDDSLPVRLTGPHGAPVVAVLGGIFSDRRVGTSVTSAGWWPGMVCAKGGIDVETYRVLSLDYAPAHLPGNATPIRMAPRDHAALLLHVLDTLEINTLAAFVGADYGGMVALAFAGQYPDRLRRLIVIGAAHRQHAQATALRSIERRIVTLAAQAGQDDAGLKLALALSEISGLTPVAFKSIYRGGLIDDADGGLSEACYVIRDRLERQNVHMAAARFLTLSAAADRHDEAPERIQTPTLIIGSKADATTPESDLAHLESQLAGKVHRIMLASRLGRGFHLRETKRLSSILESALRSQSSNS